YLGLYAIWLAMTDASLLRLARAQFIGIGNFIRLAGDPIFLDSLWRTLRWDVAVVVSELLIAYMFDGNFGAINDILVKLGILDRYVSWLSDPTGSFAVTVAAMVW